MGSTAVDIIGIGKDLPQFLLIHGLLLLSHSMQPYATDRTRWWWYSSSLGIMLCI